MGNIYYKLCTLICVLVATLACAGCTEDVPVDTGNAPVDVITGADASINGAVTEKVVPDGAISEVGSDTDNADDTDIVIEEVDHNTTIKFTIVGDCMIASYKGGKEPGSFAAKALEGDMKYFLGGVSSLFEDDDYTIANLENVLTDDATLQPVWKDHSPAYWYKAPTENINIFTESSVEVANLSNNHTGDYGAKGGTDTIAACDAAGVLWGNSDKTLYVEKDGITVAMIFNGLWSSWQADVICNRLAEASEKSDFQIVYYHGGTERIHSPEDWKVQASHKIVDAGADLVIGNHPHVLQPMEVYNGVPIIYSMGNFLFGGSNHPENRSIVYKYEATFNKETKEFVSYTDDVIPCYVYTGSTNNWRPEIIMDEAEKERVLQFMNWEISSPL